MATLDKNRYMREIEEAQEHVRSAAHACRMLGFTQTGADLDRIERRLLDHWADARKHSPTTMFTVPD